MTSETKKSHSRKRRYALNEQTIIYYKMQQILSICPSGEAVLDFEVFKGNLQQNRLEFHILADKGYQGIEHVFNSLKIYFFA